MLRMDDPFTQQMATPNAPIVCNRQMLRDLPPNEIVVKRSLTEQVPHRYFRVMDTDVPITVDEAGQFYESEEYEFVCLEKGRAPFTRTEVGKEEAGAPQKLQDDASPNIKKKKNSWGAARGAQMVRGMEFGGGSYDPSGGEARRSFKG